MPENRTSFQRAQALLEAAGLEVLQIQYAGDGSQHHLFVVELDEGPFQLLRLPREDRLAKLRTVLEAEAEAVSRARVAVPVAHPMRVLHAEGRAEGTLQPVLDGQRVTQLRSDRGFDLRSVVTTLGGLLAQLHSITLDSSGRTKIRTILEEHCEGAPTLLHGDLHLGNVLVDKTGPHHWSITGFIDWSFCAWGPPEADLVEIAICEGAQHPWLVRAFLDSYLDAGGFAPREDVFRAALVAELERRVRHHRQSHEMGAREFWTAWLQALKRPDANPLRVFDAGRAPGSALT